MVIFLEGVFPNSVPEADIGVFIVAEKVETNTVASGQKIANANKDLSFTCRKCQKTHKDSAKTLKKIR